ncbi:MAG: M24 family metallopeptidase, partial [Cyanobacteria bacterium NC_groundwater_1444_Ag_S-0.65um_54_12]|nr:M24 family metallopeptidase [Cyanobacteria bacterium NC_groundwater_1444_Ag_S-0.65um_54_12]
YPPICAVNENAGNPHYEPTREVHKEVKKGDIVLIDLWAKEKRPNSIYADITWVGFVGEKVPKKYENIFTIFDT